MPCVGMWSKIHYLVNDRLSGEKNTTWVDSKRAGTLTFNFSSLRGCSGPNLCQEFSYTFRIIPVSNTFGLNFVGLSILPMCNDEVPLTKFMTEIWECGSIMK